MSCEFVKYLGVTFAQLGALHGVLASEENRGRREINYPDGSGQVSVLYEHARLLKVEANDGFFTVELRILHFWEIPNGKEYHVSRKKFDRRVPQSLVSRIHDALGIFPAA